MYFLFVNSDILRREYVVVEYRYSRLLFTSVDQLCANLRVQEQPTNMMSQYPVTCACVTSQTNLCYFVVTSQYSTLIGDNGEMNDRCSFPSGSSVISMNSV